MPAESPARAGFFCLRAGFPGRYHSTVVVVRRSVEELVPLPGVP